MSDTPAPFGAADGLVRVYPAGLAERPTPGLLWLHGGGFAGGDLDMPEADHVARTLASAGITVCSVDYRLAPLPAGSPAPETSRVRAHYPAASDDALTAWEWMLTESATLGVDPARLAIGGASAGGNIAAGATLRLVHSGRTAPALVMLAYPTLLAVQPDPDAALRRALDAQPAADRFGPDVVLPMYENYLGGPVDAAPIAAIPGRATADELADFPPTLIVAGEVDELRVSSEHFARTLADAGRSVDHIVEPGTDHGYLNRPADGPAASLTLDRFAARLAAL
ncbi:alpha/beta hydrolase fold domain-containing protein [Microbacterium dauci]|uniref:Alpha/beta hydrolase fold domain-containing protein n=1 Tax=Microbacterium dauci TaxID=3048008 RepID=A0ABT6ZDN9_9MICO|nr:alpha/beta hydrolase fold domain-containing protein [Microbacterium sp. LX3-4]MDJ1114258.1 alpha/beta hydrolase fold domain-containing protein [Microbacterium sp. LX3-4]